MTFTETIWSHLAHHPNLGEQPDLVDTLLETGIRTVAARVLADPSCTDDQALAAAKILAPGRTAKLSWPEYSPLSERVLPVAVQRHFAKTLTGGLTRVARNFTDSSAILTIATRALPANPPAGLYVGQTRDRLAGAMALEAFNEAVENDTQFDAALLAGDIFETALNRICYDYTHSSEYAQEALSALLHLAGRHPEAFASACVGKDLPWWVVYQLTNRTWTPERLTTQVLRAIFTRLQTVPLWDLHTWGALRNISKRVTPEQHAAILNVLREHNDAPSQATGAFHTWRTEMLAVAVEEVDSWSTLPLAEVLTLLDEADYHVDRKSLPAVLGRPDLPANVAVRVLGDQQVTDNLFSEIANPDAVYAWMLSGTGVRFASLNRLLAAPGPLNTGRSETERLDLAARVVHGWAASHGREAEEKDAVERLRNLSLERLGRERLLDVPWWVLHLAAQQREELAPLLAEELAETLLDPTSRRVLLHLLEDAATRRTSTSLADLISAAHAASAA